MLQVTVPIQPGNSGGPLVTEDAQVVGVISSSAAVAPFFRSTGTLPQGINFAVSAEPAKGGFHAPPALPKVTTRHDAIERTTGALCFVESIVGDGLLLAPADFGKSEVPLSPPGLDARLRDCESGDAEACLAAALGIVRICAAKNTPACGDLRYAKTVAIHACNVGREEACRVLRDRN
jgi:hypothetical protein